MKILLYGDFYKSSSGFAREFKALIKYFPKDIEIRQVGLGYNGLAQTDIKVYPNLIQGTTNYWASEVLEYAIVDFKPDIVLSIQDYFMLPEVISVLSKPRDWKMKWIHWGVCVTGETNITLADGTIKTIKEIVDHKEAVEVLSYDEVKNEFVPKKVVNWYKRPSTLKDWLRITVRNSTRESSINVTPEHPFMTQRGWVKAGELTTEDKVFRSVDGITTEGRQAILGMYLGDGWSQNNGSSFYWGHTVKQEDYMQDTCNKFGTNISRKISKSGYGKGIENLSSGISLKTICPELITYLNKKQKVTPELLIQLGPIGLAYWYMDDGTLRTDGRYPEYFRADFCTQGFSLEEIKNIEKYFASIGIKTRTYKTGSYSDRVGGMSVTIDRESNKKFFSLIAPYIHDSMDYKLPPYYQDHLLKKDLKFRQNKILEFNFVKRELSSYATSENNRKGIDTNWRYDIEIEDTHNFIANGYLVHNCDGAPLNHHHAICASWAHMNIVHSKFGKYTLEAELEKAYKKKYEVEYLYPPIDLETYKPLEVENLRKKYRTEDRFVVLMVGKNQFRKNIPVLMEAVKKASKRITNIQLLIHTLPVKRADGSDESYDLSGLIKNMDLIEYISALRTSGPVTDEIINEIYNSVDINCLPTMGEGFGLPIAEAMAVGIPNIATNCSSMTELLSEDRGYLVNPAAWIWAGGVTKHAVLNSDDLANGIIKLWENPVLRDKMKRNSQEWIKNLEAKKIANELLNLCKKAIEEDLEPIAKQQ